MRQLLPIVALTTACGVGSPELPWLHGVQSLEVSTARTPGRVPDPVSDPCPDEAYARIDVVDGAERITASFGHGVQVFGGDGRLLESTSGSSCRDGARTITALGVGAVDRTRTIFVVDESVGAVPVITRVSVFRSGPLDRLDRVFTGIVEERDATTVRNGELSFLRNALLHVRPDGEPQLFRFDSRARAYVPRTRSSAERTP